MALITCPDCNKEVSPRAAACIHCGAPLGQQQPGVVTTQQTSKRFKGQQLAGVGVICAGVVMMFADVPLGGGVAVVAGLVLYVSGRARAWWHHA